MKKLLCLAALVLIFALAACGNGGGDQPPATPDAPPAAGNDAPAQQDAPPEDTGRPRTQLSVLTWDRGGVGNVNAADNFFTQWIQEQVLEDLNMEVTFEAIGRWDENEQLPTMMAAGMVPDLAMTWNEGMVEHFGNLGGILNLAPLLEEHLPNLPYLNAWTDYLLYQNQNPATGEIFSIMQRRVHVPRLNMFMREDWLQILDLPEPTSNEEFADTLRAFRDNADALGGIITPWALGTNVHISASPLLDAFIDHSSINDIDWWVYTIGNSSINQRHIFLPGYREGVRLLSEWFDEGLILPDFPVVDGTFIDDLMITGNAGVYVGNWDHPWRTTPNIQNRMSEENSDARLIAIDPFQNPVDGLSHKMIYPSSGFHVFIPAVSRNPVGALEYLDWMSRIENRLFLQTGVEGYHHEWTEVDGVATPAMLPVDEATSDRRWYSPNNIDLTLVINNVDVGDPLANIMFLTFNFPGIDAQRIIDSYDKSMANGRAPRMISIPGGVPITSEFLPTFNQMVDDFLTNVVTSPVENFDALWDAGIQNILNAGAQAAIDERRAGVQALGLE